MGVSAAGLEVIGIGGMLTGKGPAGGLKPRVPAPPAPKTMPDQNQILQAGQVAAAQSAALQRGRASTILTNNSDTGDKLGP